uniref:Uncharacterized protein n=1 Tax=Rhizophora mucronata TaxID=61149 RepID=A0A2P2J7I7_RHIMU
MWYIGCGSFVFSVNFLALSLCFSANKQAFFFFMFELKLMRIG